MEMNEAYDLAAQETAISTETALRLLRDWIVEALEDQRKGKSEKYFTLIDELDLIFEDAAQLRIFVQCVSYFDRDSHDVLLMQLLGTSLWTCAPEIGDVILEFAINLVAADSGMLHQCLEMLIRNFLPPSCGIPAFMGVARGGASTGVTAIIKAREKRQEQMNRKEEILGKVHATLEKMMEMVPTAPARIQPIIVDRMPHKLVEIDFQSLYVEGLFRLAESKAGTALQDQLLNVIVDRLIEIDVEIRWEDILKQEEGSSKGGKVYLFHMDLDDESDEECVPAGHLDNEMSTPGSEATLRRGLLGPRGQAVPTLDEMADKMDVLMCMTCQHIKKRFDKGEAKQVYRALVRSFVTTILDTHKSKFTQFLLFYVASLCPSECGVLFASLLHEAITSTSRSTFTRMSAAAYLASYLARAKYLLPLTILNSLSRLASWCMEYIASEDEKYKTNSLFQMGEQNRFSFLTLQENQSKPLPHSVFYAVCQAIMYALCYRLQDLLEDSTTDPLVRALPLQQILSHRLNPRLYCLESVKIEFERQAKATKLVDFRVFRSQSSDDLFFFNFGGQHRLDTFFPFDPYLLRQSSRFIKPTYVKWYKPHFGDAPDMSHDDGSEQMTNDDKADDEQTLDSGGSDTESLLEGESDREEPAGFSYSDRSQVWGSSMDDMAGTTPVNVSQGISIRNGHGNGHGNGYRFEPKSVDMCSVRSDEMSLSAYTPMSITPPVYRLEKLPPKLPPRLPLQFD